ncbi:hypothetical protein C0991_005810 [Blastosporella zonata]|nr:hypothetical protein C0991_005810 [Blastosporella zonata]
MSFESCSDETSRTLSVKISSFSSADSSFTPSPTGILSPCSSSTCSSTSLDGRLNVKFAPLPELAPRRRRSAAPLGMAARTQMVARRRQQRVIHIEPYQNNPMWTEEELEQQRQLAISESWRRISQRHVAQDDPDAEDPFIALGRAMKDAGRSIWRKVSKEQTKEQQQKEGNVQRRSLDRGRASLEKKKKEEEEAEKQRYERPPTPPSKDDLGDKDDEAFRTFGQTQTIREGDAWMADDSLEDLTSTTPTQSTH